MSRRLGRGALILVALMFASSGAIRLGDGLGAALARAAEEEDPSAEQKDVQDGTQIAEAGSGNGEGTGPLPEAESCPAPPAAVATALLERELRVSAQEAALADREAAMALADEAIRLRLEELKTAEVELRKTLALADGAAEEDIARLTAVYETMKPKDAAKLFDAMEPGFAAGFLGRMRPDAAAAILAGMTPEKAYAVSAIIAGRNASAPTE